MQESRVLQAFASCEFAQLEDGLRFLLLIPLDTREGLWVLHTSLRSLYRSIWTSVVRQPTGLSPALPEAFYW